MCIPVFPCTLLPFIELRKLLFGFFRTSSISMVRIVPLVWTLLLLPLHGIEGELIQVHIVTRHGERHRLFKHSSTLSENSSLTNSWDRWRIPRETSSPNSNGPELTLRGKEQLLHAGQQLRARYLDPCLPAQGCLRCAETPTPSDVYAVSTDFDRTLVSMQALLLGLYPLNASNGPLPPLVPVHTVNKQDDITLRAYSLCPAFKALAKQWANSSAFRAKEAELQAFLAALNGSFPEYEGRITLADFWNFYDWTMVQRADDPEWMAPLTDSKMWDDIQKIADWTETSRYGLQTAGRILGGAFVTQLVTAMGWAVANSTSGRWPPRCLYLYSAHYPTLLGILAALEASPAPSTLPTYGAWLALELHRIEGEHFVRVVYQAGPDATEGPTVIYLPGSMGLNAGPAELAGRCPWAAFQALAMRRGYSTPKQWCEDCGSQVGDCTPRGLFFDTPKDEHNAVFVALGAMLLGCFLGVGIVGLRQCWPWSGCCARQLPGGTETLEQRQESAGRMQKSPILQSNEDPEEDVTETVRIQGV